MEALGGVNVKDATEEDGRILKKYEIAVDESIADHREIYEPFIATDKTV